MLGMDSVLAQIGRHALGGEPEQPDHMGLVENTAAAVAAHFGRRPLDGRWLQVAVVERAPVVQHLTGKVLHPPPTAVLKQGSRPLALLVGELLVISRTAPRCVRVPLIREARARTVDFEEVDEGRLWRLFPRGESEAKEAA